MTRVFAALILCNVLAGCAGGPPPVPFPAFIEVDELENVFIASLPGVRSAQLAGDPMTRRTSNRVDFPPDWRGTTGGTPGRSTELFVLAGKIRLADIELGPGGYAYLPAGSLGFNMTTTDGARVLYFVSDAEPEAVIQTPILIDQSLLEWELTTTPGVTTKALRNDPGTGARTWLLRIAAGASLPRVASSVLREGYVVRGNYQHAECVDGEDVVGTYTAGGYVYRPAGAVNGGPQTTALSDTVWFLRESSAGTEILHSACIAAPPTSELQ